MIIDAWIQHPTDIFRAQPMFSRLLRWQGMTEFPPISHEMTDGLMTAAGIDRALAAAWWGPQGPLISNDDVAALIAHNPDRYVGIASVDISRPMDGVRELRRAVRVLGFKGLRMLPWLWNLPPDDRRYYPLYAECIELDIPFCLQIGHTGPLCPSEPGRPIPYLENVALEFPELRIVAGHLGFPWVSEVISLALRFPNVYVDTSAYKPKRFPPEFVQFMTGVGRKKVMYGSNYPMITPFDCLEGVDDLGFDEESKALYLGGTAKRVFKL